jgi:hypothetical protein
MPKNEFSYEELDGLIDTFNETVREKPELSDSLKPVITSIQKVKVAMLELDELREDNLRGDITEDVYLNRRKKLRMDLVVARDEVCRALPRLVKDAKDEQKSALTRAKEALKTNKDLIITLAKLATTILSKIPM